MSDRHTRAREARTKAERALNRRRAAEIRESTGVGFEGVPRVGVDRFQANPQEVARMVADGPVLITRDGEPYMLLSIPRTDVGEFDGFAEAARMAEAWNNKPHDDRKPGEGGRIPREFIRRLRAAEIRGSDEPDTPICATHGPFTVDQPCPCITGAAAPELDDARHELCDAATVAVGRWADAGWREEAKRLREAVFAFIDAANRAIAAAKRERDAAIAAATETAKLVEHHRKLGRFADGAEEYQHANPPAEPQFLILDARTIVGNCAMFWAPESKGYTCDLDAAGHYSETTARRQAAARETDVAVPLELAQRLAIRHVRVDQLREHIEIPRVRR